MGKNEKTPMTINDKEYFIEDLTDEQKVLFNHVADLDRKLSSARFNLDQLSVGRDTFANYACTICRSTSRSRNCRRR